MNSKRYRINPQHRDKNPNKSQWKISEKEEYNLFEMSFNSCWFDENGTGCFGIISNNKKLQVLGISAQNHPRQIELHFAKFVCDQNLWHGYPFGCGTSDLGQIPKSVLGAWKNHGYISNAIRNKIHKGRYPL